MKFKDLEGVISALEHQKLKIESKYLFKFGSISIAKSEPPANSQQPYTDRSEIINDFDDDDGLAVSIKLHELIESHPNVFDFQVLDEDFPSGEYRCLATKLLNGPIYRASVHLPKKQQKYQEMDCHEHFVVLGCGTYFAAYTKIDSLRTYSNIAHEYREMFKSVVIEKTSWKSPPIGPCPIHNNLIIVGVKSAQDIPPLLQPLFYTEGRNVFVVIDDSKTAEIIQELFYECLIYLTDFYELALDRLELIYVDEEIQLRMESLAEAHKGFASMPAWKFVTVQRHLSTARDHLAGVYGLMVVHNRKIAEYKRSRARFLERLRESKLLSALRTELKSDTIMDVELPDALLPSVQFFQAQADSKRGAYSVLVASLVGALIGGSVTLLATLIRGMK